VGVLKLRATGEVGFRRVVAGVAVVVLALFVAGVLASLVIVAIENAAHDGGHSGSTFIVTTTPTP
jgi:hypothetical protein